MDTVTSVILVVIGLLLISFPRRAARLESTIPDLVRWTFRRPKQNRDDASGPADLTWRQELTALFFRPHRSDIRVELIRALGVGFVVIGGLLLFA